MEAAPEDISSLAFFWTVPRHEAFPREIRGRQVFLYAALHAGAAAEGEAATAALRGIGAPILDMSGPGPCCALQSGFDPFFTRGPVHAELHAYWKSLYLAQLADSHIDRLVETARSLPTEQCLIALWHLGGAMARVPEDATAFGKRNTPYMLSFDSCWTDRALSDVVIDWTRAEVVAAQPCAAGGLYLDFPCVGEASEALIHEAYGPNYDRLSLIKRRHDPGNLFRINQNIAPA